MELEDIKELEQFEAYYIANNLQKIDDKIDSLQKKMAIRATRYDEEATKEEVLAGLEESFIFGNWKISW
jgi:hypothetical protein